MSDVELIDRLCAVTSELSDIVRKQAVFIEEQLAVDNAEKKEFAEMAAKADKTLGSIYEVYGLRPEREGGETDVC